MDIRDLKFGDSTFDVVIDKGLSLLPGQSEYTSANRDDPSTNRNNGRDDDFWGRRLGEVFKRVPVIYHVNTDLYYFQDPPEQVINDCNKEIDEVIRWNLRGMGSIWHSENDYNTGY